MSVNEPDKLGEQTVAEVDRIRDIIFGPQMRLYEQQFKRLAGQVDLLGKQLDELQARLDCQQADQESRTREVKEQAAQRDSELETNLGQQISQLRAESRQSLDQARADLTRRLEQQGSELKAQTALLGTNLDKLGLELRREHAAAVDTLEQDKAGRQQVGDLLVEMGMRLKQQMGITDLLGKLATKQEAAE